MYGRHIHTSEHENSTVPHNQASTNTSLTVQGKVAMGAQKNSFNGCMNCTDRTVEPNCHMTCKVYLNWYDELQRVKKLERQAKQGRHNQFSHSQEKGKHYI